MWWTLIYAHGQHIVCQASGEKGSECIKITSVSQNRAAVYSVTCKWDDPAEKKNIPEYQWIVYEAGQMEIFLRCNIANPLITNRIFSPFYPAALFHWRTCILFAYLASNLHRKFNSSTTRLVTFLWLNKTRSEPSCSNLSRVADSIWAS